MSELLIEGIGLTYQVGKSTLFQNIDIAIAREEHCFIKGLNGSGKTSLLKILSGEKSPTLGRVENHGVPYKEIKFISFTDEGKLFHSVNNSHYYQQRFNAWDADGHLTCREYLLAKGVDLNNANNVHLLSVLQLEALLDRERIKLSSGQTRKLILVACLLTESSILFLDNLYIGLDKESRQTLNESLEALTHSSSVTLILSSHHAAPPPFIKKNYTLGKDGLQDEVELRAMNEPNQDIDPFIKEYISSHTTAKNDEIVAFTDVSISYKETPVLKHLQWTINSGERWCLKGSNGSGKSTIMSLINADHPQIYAKDIRLFGARLGRGITIWDIKEKIGFTSPELHAYLNTSLVTEALISSIVRLHHPLSPNKEHMSQEAYQKALILLMAFYHLDDKLHLPFSNLSTGEQRVCLFIAALLRAPQLLLLDEPFQGFDIQNIEKSKHLLNRVVAANQSLIFISHFTNEIPEIVDRVLDLDNYNLEN